MANKRTGQKIVSRAEYKLPPSISREIGRLIAHWAFYEYYIQGIVWLLLDIDERHGRAATIGEARIDYRIDMIADLVALRGLAVNQKNIATLKKQSQKILDKRNLLAHGIWTKHPDDGSWRVIQTRGKYPEGFTGSHSRKRRVDPEAISVTVEGLRTAVSAAEGLISSARSLQRGIERELKSLPQKSQKQSAQPDNDNW